MTDEPEWWDHIEGEQRSLAPVERPPVVITPGIPAPPVVSPEGAWVWNGVSWQPNPWYQPPGLLVMPQHITVTVRQPSGCFGSVIALLVIGVVVSVICAIVGATHPFPTATPGVPFPIIAVSHQPLVATPPAAPKAP